MAYERIGKQRLVSLVVAVVLLTVIVPGLSNARNSFAISTYSIIDFNDDLEDAVENGDEFGESLAST